VHPLLKEEITSVELPRLQTAVYGASYHGKEVREKIYVNKYAGARQKYEILLLHGGDEKHIPLQKTELLDLGYDYIALGHIHEPGVIVPGKAEYCGALEPIDKNDTGAHGYIYGEMTEKRCITKFVPFAEREYRHLDITVTRETTAYALREMLQKNICEQGIEHIYKITLQGFKDTEVCYDTEMLDVYGNILEIEDDTRPAYDMEKLKQNNRDNILGSLIESFWEYPKDSIEYQALCEGIQALLETRRN
jgi:DNA repair exonuclease SbcCD nuclease subunit